MPHIILSYFDYFDHFEIPMKLLNNKFLCHLKAFQVKKIYRYLHRCRFLPCASESHIPIVSFHVFKMFFMFMDISLRQQTWPGHNPQPSTRNSLALNKTCSKRWSLSEPLDSRFDRLPMPHERSGRIQALNSYNAGDFPKSVMPLV